MPSTAGLAATVSSVWSGRIANDRLRPGSAGEVPVEAELEAGEAVVVDARVAEDLGGHGVLRVGPALLGIEAEAGYLLRLQNGRLCRVGLPRDVDKAAGAVRELR